jgi:hypothetical protein
VARCPSCSQNPPLYAGMPLGNSAISGSGLLKLDDGHVLKVDRQANRMEVEWANAEGITTMRWFSSRSA